MLSSNSPCGACKCLRRKCTQKCVFAPYFPPDRPQKFVNVHKVFGASNVGKLLKNLNPPQREDAVNSLAYEAEERLNNPIYGCVGLIYHLQNKLTEIQSELYGAKWELASYVVPSLLSSFPLVPPSFMHHHNNNLYGMQSAGILRDNPAAQYQQQIFEAQQQMAAANIYDQSPQPQAQPAEIMRFNSGFETAAADYNHNQMPHVNVAGTSSSSYYHTFASYHHPHPSRDMCHQFQFPPPIIFQPQNQLQPQREKSSEEGSELLVN